MFEPPLLVFGGGNGVIDMALLSVIRRWHFREHLSIREISRRTGLSRNTVRKYLRSGDVEPKFKVPERPSKLDSFADRLSAWLKTEANKPRKQKRTLGQFACRPDRPWLQRLVQSGCGLRPGLESRQAKGTTDVGSRDLRAAGV
jgi:transcriptional regulator with XRE-family HTH domain